MDRGNTVSVGQRLPIVFAVLTMIGLYAIYTTYHTIPLLSDGANRSKAMLQSAIFNALSFLLMVSYLRAILTNPGNIPMDDPTWDSVPSKTIHEPETQEKKVTGERRYCKWCVKYKPDRSHHCRICKTCILKMDHHCPWICNCVGGKNHKFFFLLVLYGSLSCLWMASTMIPTVAQAVHMDWVSTGTVLLIFGEALSVVLGLLLAAYFCFHAWLMLQAATTIEFCEKYTKKQGFRSSAYDLGPSGNVKAVLGNYMVSWLLPINPPSGDGINFRNEAEIAMIIETGRELQNESGYGAMRASKRLYGSDDGHTAWFQLLHFWAKV